MTDSPDSVANMEKAFGTIWVGLSLMKDYFNCRLVYFLLIKSVLSTLILLPIIIHCDDLGSSWILLHFKRFRVWAPHPWNLTELPQAYVREMAVSWWLQLTLDKQTLCLLQLEMSTEGHGSAVSVLARDPRRKRRVSKNQRCVHWLTTFQHLLEQLDWVNRKHLACYL